MPFIFGVGEARWTDKVRSVGLSDRDRKILWGRSGNRCAMCRVALVADRTASDSEAVVGDEAHIVARSPGGPRAGGLVEADLDAYDNMILLCRVHHKVIDDQTVEYDQERLHQIKAKHEAWVTRQLDERAAPEPVRLVKDPSAPPLQLHLLNTGDDVWAIISDSQAHQFQGPGDGEVSPEVCDRADQFLDEAKDWAEISSDVIDYGRSHVRNAKRSLGDHLTDLRDNGLVVFGGTEPMIIKGGFAPPSRWANAVLVVLRGDDPRIVARPESASGESG
jgi:hypothetical protein